jgi:hypothetical protein
MIKSKSEKQIKQLEIDLTGPDGNAFVLLAAAEDLSRRLGFPSEIRKDILELMRSGDYDNLIEVFDMWFGDYVILWR